MNPKLRPLESQIVDHNGQPLLLLQDRLQLAGHGVAVAPQLGPLLALCDGTRSLESLRATFALRTGVMLPLDALAQLFEQLDAALLLESPRFLQAKAQVVEAYRALPHRPLALAGESYPGDGYELADLFGGFGEGIEAGEAGEDVRGLICPHIDYRRGGRTYARTWARAAAAVRSADLVIALGTDHAGGGRSAHPDPPTVCHPVGSPPSSRRRRRRDGRGAGRGSCLRR